jgi:transmembrane sensor
MENHKQVEDKAAAWLARRDSGIWSEVDQAHLTRWLEESIAHRVAFLRLEAVWDETRRVKALGAGRAPGTVPAPGEWRHAPFFESGRQPYGAAVAGASTPSPADDVRAIEQSLQAASSPSAEFKPRARRWRLIAMAASLLLAVGIGGYVAFSPAPDHFSTPIGGIASVPLQDGSNITLNTASKVRVDLSPNERRIELQQGEAFFEVAKDPKRPFIVRIGNKRVIAVGTKFSIRRGEHNFRVAVTEGKVRVETVADSAASGDTRNGVRALPQASDAAGAESPRNSGLGEAFLTSGSIASVGDDGIVIEEQPRGELEDDLSWRQGYLTFHDKTLASVVAEFNRYNTHKIAIQDPRIAAIRISGTFRAVNYKAFIRVLNDGFSIQAKSTEDTTILTE